MPNPFVPNATPDARAAMLRRIGVERIEQLYAAIPERLRVSAPLDLPGPLASEAALERHFDDLFRADLDPATVVSFLGGGCRRHHVPALCEEIVSRAEFLTAYWANAYTDHGKYQAFYEYASLLGELLEQDAVCLPTYDWGMAAAVSLRMAARATGRSRILVASEIGPERAGVLRTYLAPDIEVVLLASEPGAGTVDPTALASSLGEDVAAIYIESPCYLGAIEPDIAAVAGAAHAAGALLVAGCDPAALGVLAPPAALGADITCGELQPLGVPMLFGGGLSGFIATGDDERLVREYPTFLIGRTDTSVPGEHGFGLVAWERTSYMQRERGKDFGGTTTALWSIAAAVYLALLGPHGIRELGEGILQRRAYLADRLRELPGVELPAPAAARFAEFPISYAASGRTVADVNRHLRSRGILGGHDISGLPLMPPATALVGVTELHTQTDLDRLVEATAEAVSR